MSKTIANLTLKLVADEIENILDGYHYHPYRQAFASPELRQQLVAYVLNTVPACYAMIEDTETYTVDLAIIPAAIHAQLQMVIAQGIERLIAENSDWVDHHIPQEVNAGCSPSSWFG